MMLMNGYYVILCYIILHVESYEDEQEDLLDVHAVPNHDQPNVDIADVWRCGDTVRPLKDEEAQVLARLREVYRSKRKENVPSLKQV